MYSGREVIQNGDRHEERTDSSQPKRSVKPVVFLAVSWSRRPVERDRLAELSHCLLHARRYPVEQTRNYAESEEYGPDCNSNYKLVLLHR